MEYLDFCISDKKSNQSPLNVDSVYCVFADEKYNVSHLKIPKSYVMVATLSGKGKIDIDKASYELHAGDIFLFDASKSNFNYNCLGTSWNFWWFEFRASVPDFIDIPLYNVINHPLNENEIYLCEEALCSLKLKDVKTSSSLFSALVSLLQRQTKTEGNDFKGVDIFKKADEYIRMHLATATVKSTAEYLKISERTLLTVFRNQLNISTVSYINNLKTDMARHMLLTGDLNIKSIAEKLGYPDQFSFSKCFKKRFGISPNKYRSLKNIN